MIIQYALVGLMLGVLGYFLVNRNSASVRAWKKLALVAFVALGILAVIDPELTNDIASLVGIGRGADLLLYLTVVAFVFVSLNIYLKFRDVDERLGRIARRLALLEERLQRVGGPDDAEPPAED